MAFPQIAGTQKSVETSSVTAHDVTLPASVAADDILIAWVFQDGASGGFSWPAGWTEVIDSAVVSTEASVTVGWRRATGGETTVQVTSVTAERSTHIAVRITGAHTTTDPEFSATASGTSANPNPDSLNPTNWDVEDTLWIAWQVNDLQATSAFPYASNNVSTSSSDVTSASYGAICSTESAVASIDPGTFTIGASDQWRAGTVAVRPAGGSSPIDFAPAAVSMSLTPVAPTYALSLTFSPAAVPMPLTPVAPTFVKTNTFTPAAVPMPLTVVTPTFTFDWNFAPSAVPMPLTPVAPTFNKSLSLSIAAVPMPLTPVAPTFNKSLSLSIAAVPMPLTPVAPTLALSLAFAPAAVPMPLTPVAPTFVKSLTLTPAAVPMPLAVVAPTYALSLSLSPAPQPMVFGVVAPTLNSSSPSAIAFTPGAVPMELAVVAPTLLGGGLQFAGDALSTDPRVRFYWYKGLNRGNPKRR